MITIGKTNPTLQPCPASTELTVQIIEPTICLIIFTKSSITSAFLNFLEMEKFYKDLNKIGTYFVKIKGSSDPSYFTFEINVGKSRIRHRTTPKSNC